MPRKRQYSRRHIKILALQRCSRAISLAIREGLLIPHDFPTYGADYPYGVELDMECSDIAHALRLRLADLAEREFKLSSEEHKDIYREDSDRIKI